MVQKLINAENSDLFDVLEYILMQFRPSAGNYGLPEFQSQIFTPLEPHQREFLEFVLAKYIETGVGELAQEKLPDLLVLKYQAIEDARVRLGDLLVDPQFVCEFSAAFVCWNHRVRWEDGRKY